MVIIVEVLTEVDNEILTEVDNEILTEVDDEVYTEVAMQIANGAGKLTRMAMTQRITTQPTPKRVQLRVVEPTQVKIIPQAKALKAARKFAKRDAELLRRLA